MNCYKGKDAHKTTLNFYANELQILGLAQEDLLGQAMYCFTLLRHVVKSIDALLYYQYCFWKQLSLLLSFSVSGIKIQDWGNLQKLLNTKH